MKPPTFRVSTMLSEALLAKLDTYCAEHDLSRMQVIRRALREFLKDEPGDGAEEE